jgi:23S rRNA pseudouridine1911/1915/1917 synthase
MEKTIIVSQEFNGKRLDLFLAKNFDSLSRTKISRLISQQKVLVDGQHKKASFHLYPGASVIIDVPQEEPFTIIPFEQNIPIIYEDNEILVVNKPQGMSTHMPHYGSIPDTLVNALFYMRKQLAPINPLRPGIVHRLDRDTSGVMVIAKTNRAYLRLMEQFRRRTTKKEYQAICWGVMQKDSQTVNLPLARDTNNRLKMRITFLEAKNALTDIIVIQRFSDSTYLMVKIHTGRMHQIRVHMNFLGFPLVGDKKYGKTDNYSLMLHAYKLGFNHPLTNKFIEFTAEIPERFNEFFKERK